MAQGRSFNIEVMNSTHRVGYKEKHHLGCACIVEVPDTCFIILSSHLYHYGDRAQFCDFSFQMNTRFFALLKNPHYQFGEIDQTFPAIPSYWCLGCEKCEAVAAYIGSNKCFDDIHKRWFCPLHERIIRTLVPGTHIMGDLETLGWAIVKGFTVADSECQSFVVSMQKLRDEFVQGKIDNERDGCNCNNT